MVHFIELLFFLFVFKAILRCLYFWQLKEYRIDRFTYFIKSSEFIKFLLPVKSLLRPKFTLKIILLTIVSLNLSFQILKSTPQQVGPFLAYFLVPVYTSLGIITLMPFTSLFYQLIIWLAKIKLKQLSKNLTVIGITGSYGKTSTKEILAHLLSVKFQVCKTPATKNTSIGVALTILKSLSKSHQVFIVEMGAYKKGEIKQICQLVKPQIGILTGITKQHLGLFGNFDNLKKAKLELIQSLPANGLAVINTHNIETKKIVNQIKSVKVVPYQMPKTKLQTNLIGNYQQLNIQAAATVAKHLKIPIKLIQNQLLGVPKFITAVTTKTGLNQAQVIDDSYNSNPEGFKNMINLAKVHKARNKILITPGIIELGQESKKIHQQLFKQAETVFDQIFVTKKDLSYLTSKKTKLETNYQKLLKKLKPNSDTLILIEGRQPTKFIKTLCQNQS